VRLFWLSASGAPVSVVRMSLSGFMKNTAPAKTLYLLVQHCLLAPTQEGRKSVGNMTIAIYVHLYEVIPNVQSVKTTHLRASDRVRVASRKGAISSCCFVTCLDKKTHEIGMSM